MKMTEWLRFMCSQERSEPKRMTSGLFLIYFFHEEDTSLHLQHQKYDKRKQKGSLKFTPLWELLWRYWSLESKVIYPALLCLPWVNFSGSLDNAHVPSESWTPPSLGWQLPLAEDSASLVLSDAILLAADLCCLPVLGGSGLDVFQDTRRTMRHSCFWSSWFEKADECEKLELMYWRQDQPPWPDLNSDYWDVWSPQPHLVMQDSINFVSAQGLSLSHFPLWNQKD